jgi:PAS domain S-box-containing protein
MTVRRHEVSATLLTDLLFDDPDVGRCLVAPDGSVLRANAEWLRSTGFSLDDVLGGDIIERARAGHRVAVPRHAVRIDGRETWWEGSIAPVPMEGGTGLLITARELTGLEVAAGEERYRTLVEVSPDAVFVNRGERVSFVNPAMVKLFGASSPDQLVGKNALDLFHPECHDLIRSRIARLMSGAKYQETIEERILRLDGGSVDVDVTATAFDDERGRAVQVIVRDATARKAADAALREIEMRLRRLYESGMIGVLHFDLDGGLFDANDKFLSTVGYTRDDLVAGRLAWDRMTPPEYRHLDDYAVAELKSGGVDTPYEKEFIRKDGSRVPIIIGAATYDEQRHRGIAFIVDISDRKRAEAALTESAERFETLADNIAQLAWMADKTGWIFWYNRRWYDYTGTTLEQMQGWGWQQVHHPDHVARVVEKIRRCFEAGEPWEDTFPLRRHDGEYRWFLSRAVPIRDATGRVTRWFGTNTDVTEQLAAEAALRNNQAGLEQERARLQAVIDTIPVGFFLVDASGKVVVTNDDAERMWRGAVPLEKVSDYDKYVGYWPDTGERLKAEEWPAAQALLNGRRTKGVMVDIDRFDGTRGTILFSGAPIQDRAGKATGAVIATQDISDLRAAHARLEEVDRRKTEFLAMLSHELRNPLAPIRNSIYLLERAAPESDQATRARDVMRRQTEHLTRLVDDLLDVTRISHGKIPLERSTVDLREIVRKTTDDLHSAFTQAGITLRLDYVTVGPMWVDADPTRIAQILTNLLNNSLKFTPNGGTVRVSGGARDGRAELRVADDGMGMHPNDIEHMFEPFAQADQSLARSKGGLGLGLALVKSIAELHGGSVSARSEGPGRGSEFLVRLPLVAAGTQSKRDRHVDARTTSRTILIIEDNVDGAQSLAEILEFHGHRVRVARDGCSGIATAKEFQPDTILCDIGLPDVDGYDVARTLRQDGPLRGTRLVALSGYAQPEDRRRARDAGFDAHLVKPVDLDELMRVLNEDR